MMTNTKFTELLNLYLDHEIGMEDAAALEAEIQQNPERREIYRQYCQIHKGCAQLASSFAGAGAADLTRDLAARRNQSSRRHFAAWTVGLGAMAAACFAVVLLNRESASVVPASVAQANQASPTQVAVAPAVYSLPPIRSRGTEMHSVFAPTLVNSAPASQPSRSMYVNAQGNRFEWMDRVDTTNPDDDYGFQVRPTVQDGQRTFRSQRPIEGRVEMTAFQFQR